MKTVCICGGGALGHVISGILASQGIRVNVLTNNPEKWSKTIKVEDLYNKEYIGNLQKVSSLPEEVIPQADIVLLTLPGFLINKELLKIKKYLKDDTIIGSVVSSTGFFIMAARIFGEKYNLFGFQRTPYIARVKEYGSSAYLLGYKKLLKMAFSNKSDSTPYISFFQNGFNTEIILLNHILEATVTNSNPILHPSRLYSLFNNWDNSIVYPENILFYEDWNNFSSRILIECDKELQNIITQLPIDQREIVPLLEYYESVDESTLTNKIKSIEAFKGIKVPMKKVEKGFMPDFQDRYFVEDIPYGLLLLKNIAHIVNVSTPIIDMILEWGQKVIDKEFIKDGLLVGKDINEISCIDNEIIRFIVNKI